MTTLHERFVPLYGLDNNNNTIINVASAVNGTDAMNKNDVTTAISTAVSAVTGGLIYQGTWNASTNTPSLVSGTGTKGRFYKVSVAGSTTIDGISQWNVGDMIAFDGTTWDKIDGIASEVVSVAGRTGAVTLNQSDIAGLTTTSTPTFGSVTATTFTGNLVGNASTATTAGTVTTAAQPSITSVGTLSALTVSSVINGSISGNAATVTTNANLTGDVTSTGNITTIGKIGGQAISLAGALVFAGAFSQTFTATANSSVTVPASGTLLSTTSSVGTFPTLNQNTTGNAATATLAATATNIAGGAAGGIPYQTGSGITAILATGSGVLVGGTTPSYSSAPTLTGTNFTGIPNAGLTNSSITVGSTNIALGGTATTIAGLNSVTSTTFIGSLTGNASTATSATSAGNVTGTVAIANGGTGATSVSAAATALGLGSASSVTFNSVTAGTFTGSLNGNATTATTATNLSWSGLTAPTTSNSVTAAADTTQTLLGTFDSGAGNDQSLFVLGESVASTKVAGNTNKPRILTISTLAGSTALPLEIIAQGQRSVFQITNLGGLQFNGLASSVSSSIGGNAQFIGGAGNASFAGGPISLAGGAGAGAGGGGITLSGGNDSGAGPGGSLSLTAGTSATGTNGNITFVTGGSTQMTISNVGVVTLSSALPISSGGTGTTTAAGALSNLGGVASTLLGANNGVATLNSAGQLNASQIPASLLGALQFQGTWNASTNTPTLTSSTGTNGQFYVVNTAGSTILNGNSQWNVGDMLFFGGSAWNKIDGVSLEVLSVAGRTGAVTLSQSDISGLTTSSSPTFAGLTLSGLNANSFLYSNTSGTLTTTTAPTNGQLLIGSTGVAPVVAALTNGSGISVTNGAGSITVANTGVLSLTSGSNISLSASTGNVTVSSIKLYAESVSSQTTPTATGTNSVALGNGSSSTATNAVGIGNGSNSSMYGSTAITNNKFATAGDSQYILAVSRIITTAATTSEMFLDGAGATQRLVLPNNSAWVFNLNIVARRTDATGVYGAWNFNGLVYRDATASTTVLGASTKTAIARVGGIGGVLGANDPTVTADTTNGSLKLSVTGVAAQTIRWVATVELTQVTN